MPRTCTLPRCTINHRGADCDFTGCDTAVGSYSDDTSDVVEVHANINTANADPVAHVVLMVNDAESDYSPEVARKMATAILTAADLAEAGARRKSVA